MGLFVRNPVGLLSFPGMGEGAEGGQAFLLFVKVMNEYVILFPKGGLFPRS